MSKSSSVPHRATEMSLPEEVDKDAKERGINVSQTCERAVQVETDRQWAARYVDFVRAYNDMLERDGLPLAQHQTF